MAEEESWRELEFVANWAAKQAIEQAGSSSALAFVMRIRELYLEAYQDNPVKLAGCRRDLMKVYVAVLSEAPDPKARFISKVLDGMKDVKTQVFANDPAAFARAAADATPALSEDSAGS